MRCIRKVGTDYETEGRKWMRKFMDGCWREGRYVNLRYDRSHMDGLDEILVDEQRDEGGNSYCCYCMRKLHLKDEKGENDVTLEHIVPNKIKADDWERDKDGYLQFPNLDAEHIMVCYGGELTEEQRKERIAAMPYPHFVSYHNLVASCDGRVFEKGENLKGRCCNNNRGERFVLPIFLSEELVERISYDTDGRLICNGSDMREEWFDREHLNLNNVWIVAVRKIWCLIARSEYTVDDVQEARKNTDLREDIIAKIDPRDKFTSLVENDTAWGLLSEYSWFYHYYCKMSHPETATGR